MAIRKDSGVRIPLLPHIHKGKNGIQQRKHRESRLRVLQGRSERPLPPTEAQIPAWRRKGHTHVPTLRIGLQGVHHPRLVQRVKGDYL